MRRGVHDLTLERRKPAPEHIRLGYSELFRETEQALVIELSEENLHRLPNTARTLWSHVS
jgi:hypothetical protein